MKCPECGAEVYDDIKKCPFCKIPLKDTGDDKFKNFDFTYTITSDEQIKAIRESVNEVAKESASSARTSDRKSSRRRRRRRKAVDKVKIMRAAVLVIAAALVALIIFGVCALVSAISRNDSTAKAYTYIKDNSLYLVYEGKNTEISANIISDAYLRKADTYADLSTGVEASKSSKLIKMAENNRIIYYFENYDPETNIGDLMMIKDGKKKNIEKVAESVHNSFVMTDDGEKLLFLQSTDKNGDMGVLHYYKRGMDAPLKIATDIDHGTYVFSADGKDALFIQNLNRVEMKGDLYRKSVEKLKEEKVKLDTDVCAVFGTNYKSSAYIYGKGFDKEDSTFDVYAMNKRGETLRLGERTKRSPIVLKKRNTAFVFGAAQGRMSNLYSVEISSGKKEKIASEINLVLRISEDEKTIIYDKIYENKVSDYFIYTKGGQPQKLAENITIEGRNTATAPQVGLKEDYSEIAYISGFESVKGGGVLYTAEYKNGKVGKKTVVAEDVYCCYRAENGDIIFAKDYSRTRKVFDLYISSNGNIKLLKEEIYPEMFVAEKNGDTIFYVTDFNVSGPHGGLEKMEISGDAEQIASGVFSIDLTEHGDLFFSKNLDTENGKFDLYLAEDGKSSYEEIDKMVDVLMAD